MRAVNPLSLWFATGFMHRDSKSTACSSWLRVQRVVLEMVWSPLCLHKHNK